MPRTDVAVVGAGLSGLTAALTLADAGARVHVIATGHAATHWAPGGIDAGVLPGAGTPAEAVERLAAIPGHPYALLAHALPDAIDWLRSILAEEGLVYAGTLDDLLRLMPTAIGSTRPVAILPDGMSAALGEWAPDERLVVCGPAGFRDFWPDAIAASLRRSGSWRGGPSPSRVDAAVVDLPGLSERHNLSGLDVARAFDDPRWRDAALDLIATALRRSGRGPGRVALPAVLGLEDHAAVLAAARERLPLAPFEVPLAPPSVPGLRLYRALRSALLRRGGRIQIGETAHGQVGADGRVDRIAAPAAAREFVLSVGGVILATGGIGGGGIVAADGGTLVETVLGLPVEGPATGDWLMRDPFDPTGHPIETCGIRTDATLRPVAPGGTGPALASNVRIVGSLLPGQRYVRERCGDGVAIASGRVGALAFLGERAAARGGTGGAADAPRAATRAPASSSPVTTAAGAGAVAGSGSGSGSGS